MFTFVSGVSFGRMNANGTASLSSHSGSAVVRLKVTLLPLTTTPLFRVQVFGVLMHASAPWMTLYQVPAFGLFPILNRRSKVALTSAPVRGSPFENLIPLRSVNVQVLPSFVGFGIDVTRSGTFFVPSEPPTRLKAIRPSCVKISHCHTCSV